MMPARSLTCDEARALLQRSDVLLVDLREIPERERDGVIPGSVHAPLPLLLHHLAPGGSLREAAAAGKRLLFYCAAGPRSMRAMQAAQQAGFSDAAYLEGGIIAWSETGGPIEKD